MADNWDLARIEAQAPTPKAWAEGKKLATGGAFSDLRPHPEVRRGWQAATRGSSGTYATTVVDLARSGLSYLCTCPSAQRPCKHALGLAYLLATTPELRPEPDPPPAVAPELDALVPACFANPKHNLPRLVLADYLEERGETDRATVLRIQCERPPPKKGEKPKIGRGLAKPLKEAVQRLFAGFAIGLPVEMEFRRGFLTVQINPSLLQMAGAGPDTLLKLLQHGWVETLVLSGYGGHESAEVNAALRNVGVIDLTGCWLGEETLLTVASEFRPGRSDSRVRQVIVPKASKAALARLLGDARKPPPVVRRQSYTELTPEKFRTVLDTGLLNAVHHLTLGGDVGEDGLRRFAASPAPRQLRSLTLFRLDAAPAALRHLWRLHPTRLQELEIDAVPLGDAGVAELCAGALIPRDSLEVRTAGLTSAAAVTLAGCDRFARLKRLDLTGNRIGADGLAAVLASPHLSRIESLDAGGPGVAALELLPDLFAAPPRSSLGVAVSPFTLKLTRSPTRGAELVVACERFDRRPLNWPGGRVCPEPLSELTIDGAELSGADWRRLRAWLAGQTLTYLAITSCVLRNDDMPEVLALMGQVRPTELNLRGNEIGMNGCKAMADSPALATVRTLRMGGNPIRASGALALAASPHRANLKAFHPGQTAPTQFEAAEKKRIAAAFKGVRVNF